MFASYDGTSLALNYWVFNKAGRSGIKKKNLLNADFF